MPVRSIRIYNATTEEWEPLGVSQLDLSDANPQNLGSADSGVSESASRSDHVHSMPTASDVGAQPADADLTAIAGLSGSSGLLKKTAANTWTLDTASYATTDSPALTGTPTAPTAGSGTSTTQIATTAFVQTAVSNLIDGAPAALDTLNELAAALNDDSSYASTITNALALKADLASPTFTGTPAAPTAAANTNTTQIATTAFVLGQAASSAPPAIGAEAVGTSNQFARQDHVHSVPSGLLLSSPVLLSPEERCNVVASAATGTINLDVLTAGVWYYTSNASANHTLNIRGNSSSTLSSVLAVGDSITVIWLNTNGGTAYYPNVIQVDGTNVTPKWAGGSAPTSGNASSIDVYSFTVIKTAATPTYTVLGGQTRFA